MYESSAIHIRQTRLLVTMIALACLHVLPLQGQVRDDFELGSLNGWYSEGDGTYSLSSTQGNPGSSFKVDDNATGSINYAIAPRQYLGDWSSATASDSISMHVYVESSLTKELTNDYPIFTLVGPSSRASILNGLNLAPGTWHVVSAPLDSTQWVIEQGNWHDLMQNIRLIRIRAEHIQGNENVYLDNIGLSFTPVLRAINGSICSDFEDSTLDGWRGEDVSGVSTADSYGNPGFGIRFGDRSSVIGLAFAPPKFLGDWSSIWRNASLQMDIKIETSASSIIDKPYLILIEGGARVRGLPPISLRNRRWSRRSISGTGW